jgi:hypothetical protein
MNITDRRKLAMATSVRDFFATHPYANPGYTAAGERLTLQITRADGLAQQQIAGRQAVSGAVAQREELRAEITASLALLGGLLRQAAREDPNLGVGLNRPERGEGVQAFLSRGRVAAARASEHRELLVKYGMPEDYPAGLSGLLDRFEAAVNAKHAARSAHVGAAAELTSVVAEIMDLVGQLDTINRFRFRDDAESLAAWRSARNVAWPAGDKTRESDKGVQPAA